MQRFNETTKISSNQAIQPLFTDGEKQDEKRNILKSNISAV